jgi:hypothetical protein
MTQKKLALTLGLGLIACGFSTGCWSAKSRPHTSKETLSESSDEHFHRSEMILDRERRAMAEDLDLLFLTERPTRLSRWHGK